MRIFYDTEFIEDGHTVDLVSIGMVAEDGRELYAVSSEFDEHKMKSNPWLMANVWPSLPTYYNDHTEWLDLEHPDVMSRDDIARKVREFVQATPDVDLWADYGAYDHVALCQLYGPMIALPAGFPMWTHDFQQAHELAGRPPLPEQTTGLHNALADACHLRDQFLALQAAS